MYRKGQGFPTFSAGRLEELEDVNGQVLARERTRQCSIVWRVDKHARSRPSNSRC
jgi:hypothetical protein